MVYTPYSHVLCVVCCRVGRYVSQIQCRISSARHAHHLTGTHLAHDHCAHHLILPDADAGVPVLRRTNMVKLPPLAAR